MADKNFPFLEATLVAENSWQKNPGDFFINSGGEAYTVLEDGTLQPLRDKTYFDILYMLENNKPVSLEEYNSLDKNRMINLYLKGDVLPENVVTESVHSIVVDTTSNGFKRTSSFKIGEDITVKDKRDNTYHNLNSMLHTMMTLDEMARILKEEKIEDEYKKLYLFYGILCHDLGKPFCTKEINKKITSFKHESLGIEPTISFLSKLTNEKKFIEIVCSLVKNHLTPFQLYLSDSSLKAIKRLSLKVNIEDLCLVCLADCLGRDIKDKEKCPKATAWLLNKAKELDIHKEPIKAVVLGRDLITLGFKPSQKFKEILDFAFDLQLDEDMKKDEIILKIKDKYLS